jgi:hypothetical protein
MMAVSVYFIFQPFILSIMNGALPSPSWKAKALVTCSVSHTINNRMIFMLKFWFGSLWIIVNRSWTAFS